MALADVVQEAQEPINVIYAGSAIEDLNVRLESLKSNAKQALLTENIQESDIYYEEYLNMRYSGTETAMMILRPASGNFRDAFLEQHLREFNFIFPESRSILVDDIRVRGIGGSGNVTADADKLHKELSNTEFSPANNNTMEREVRTYFSGVGLASTPVYLLEKLTLGSTISGPAMILDNTQSIVVVPGAQAKILTAHVVIDIPQVINIQTSATEVDPIQLSVFAHRFMSIAEQMGRILQKTCVSLNIKERLDFSCAVFGPDGGLVANAPHVPVHLGSMSYAVQYQHELLKGELQPGDVLVSNHPEAGGAHLPDVTVITPVFSNNNEIAFYVGSRGHHTDIGGLGGTSMPPNSTELWQEGAAIKSLRLIHDGHFDEEGIKKILTAPGDLPGCTPSRRLDDNLSDLKAQVAANNKGMTLIQALMEEYGQDVVQLYMRAIQENAEVAVRAFLRQTLEKRGAHFSGVDQMDNGSEMHLAVSIDPSGSATFDFTGTAPEMYSNMNAPPSITYSAIIYTLRLLIGLDIPLNQGCLSPISIILPKGSFLNPSSGAAVCAGNTQTSQRVVDVILKTFDAAAASHGCMNCLGFFGEVYSAEGKEHSYAFGETICGGSGATAIAHGASAVHTHMTNTRITDPETLERRYPVILREFAIRNGSGGKGRFNGGDGAIRDIECRAPIRFSVITERRAVAPYGMMGGGTGAKGVNYWVRRVEKEGSEKEFVDRWINMGAKNMVSMKEGDRCIIYTPGGGAWGIEGEEHIDSTKGVWEGIKVRFGRAAGSLASRMDAQAASN
jgi:5-oxoprolinase (ATP-hydrolysing)